MAESPKRPADSSHTEASRAVKPARPAGPTRNTSRVADSSPAAVGPFTVLPTRFGRYRIDKLLGSGAMGAVYLAHDSQLDRPVALKVARVSAAGSTKAIQRMETEAKAAAKVDHPQICKVYDFGEIDGIRFIALQYIEGEDLKSYLGRVDRKREPSEAIRLVLQIARALEAAHAKDVIHRDLKPGNIMLNQKGEPVIMDFGLARRLSGATNAGLTQGMILGTAAYMSPEQAAGMAEGIDNRSDLYSLGVMLFELLTGDWPFTGSAIEVIGKKSVQEAPSPLSLNASIPPQLAAICQKMIARKKEDRFATCAEVIAALEAVDLKALVPLRMKGEPPEATSPFADQERPSFTFLDSTSAVAPSIVSTPTGKKAIPAKSLSHSAPVRWWCDQPLAMRCTILGCAGVCGVVLAVALFFRPGDAIVSSTNQSTNTEVESRSAGNDYRNTLEMEFVRIPKGKSWLGGSAGKFGDQEVEFADDFYLGKYEVTQDEWENVMGNHVSHFSRNGPGKDAVKDVSDADLKRFPVGLVSGKDCQEFATRLNQQLKEVGWIYRLPTEAEWEYACRGGPMTDRFDSAFDFYFDRPKNELLPENARFGLGHNGFPNRVDANRPNRLGLYGMHDNMHEWCQGNARPVVNGEGILLRGGSYFSPPDYCRAITRFVQPEARTQFNVGFRMARVRVGEIAGLLTQGADSSSSPSQIDLKRFRILGGQ